MNRDQKIPWKNVELALKEELYFVKLVDETRMAVDYEEMAREKSLRGYFVQELLLQRKEAEKSGDEKAMARIDKALDYGMKAFEGQVGLGDY
jgi:hypothetical protein